MAKSEKIRKDLAVLIKDRNRLATELARVRKELDEVFDAWERDYNDFKPYYDAAHYEQFGDITAPDPAKETEDVPSPPSLGKRVPFAPRT